MAEPTNETMTPEEALAAIRRLAEMREKATKEWSVRQLRGGSDCFVEAPRPGKPYALEVFGEVATYDEFEVFDDPAAQKLADCEFAAIANNTNFAAILGALEGVVREKP